MIYLFTDNFYLRTGIEHAMSPVEIECLDAVNFISKITSATKDIFLIDDNIMHREIFSNHLSIAHNNRIIFINTNRNINSEFLRVNLGHAFVNKKTIPGELPKVLESIFDKYNLLINMKHHRKLTPTEKRVLLDTVNGKNINEITMTTGLNNKSIYAYRKRVCLKMGVNRFQDIFPFPGFLLIALSDGEQKDVYHKF